VNLNNTSDPSKLTIYNTPNLESSGVNQHETRKRLQAYLSTETAKTKGEKPDVHFYSIDPSGPYLRVIKLTREKHYQESLVETFDKLWQSTCACFKREHRPRGLWRHRVIESLFYEFESRRRNPSNFGDYLLARAVIELALTTLANKGNIDLINSLSKRFGVYYREYVKHCKDNSHRFLEFKSYLNFLG
jgi:hypothetical protein